MILRVQSGSPRGGFSLLEVLVALTIFLFSLVALGHLLNISADMVQETRYTNRAAQLLQTQMNRVISGEVALSSQGESSFSEEPDWSWTIDAQADNTIPNLWTVTIKVSRARPAGGAFEAALTQMILDPAAKGTIEAPSTTTNAAGTTPGTGN
jgi:prepilin-type N-terminal cleavage/methylation domain-containing protein